jgi:hypothetical protein
MRLKTITLIVVQQRPAIIQVAYLLGTAQEISARDGSGPQGVLRSRKSVKNV